MVIPKPGTVLVSSKPPESCVWPPVVSTIKCLFRYFLKCKGKRKYPNGWGWEADHCRIYIGPVFGQIAEAVGVPDGTPVVFEFTSPVAKFSPYEPWMIESPYCLAHMELNPQLIPTWHPFHPSAELSDELKAQMLYDEFAVFAGTGYDFGQLIDIWIGWDRVFDFGKKQKVCSVGIRVVLDEFFGFPTMPEINKEKTLPCSFINSPFWNEAIGW